MKEEFEDKKHEREIVYVEPEDYFPRDLREEFFRIVEEKRKKAEQEAENEKKDK